VLRHITSWDELLSGKTQDLPPLGGTGFASDHIIARVHVIDMQGNQTYRVSPKHWRKLQTGTGWESYLAYHRTNLVRLKKTTKEMIDERQKPWIHGCNKNPVLHGVMW